MGLVKVHFEVENDVQFTRAFEFALSKYANFEESFGLMADAFFASMVEVFESEGAYQERSRWQDLSPAYARWKERHFPGRKILERTGRMRRSLTMKGGEDNVLEITPTELTVGTRVPYAMFHQKGGGRLPQRKIIELTEKDKLEWVHIMHRYMYDVNETVGRMTRGA